MSRYSDLLSAVIITVLVAISVGCVAPSVMFKAAGHVDGSDEILEGYVQVDARGAGSITLVNTSTGMRCTGLSQATYQPTHSNVGTIGKAYVQCDDSRRIEVTWVHTTEAGGGGVGVDQHGQRMTIRFSMHAAEVQAFIDGVTRHARKGDAIPAPTAAPKLPEAPTMGAAGSGAIVSPEGHVLTANHIIEGCSQLTVKAGERATDAQVLAVDAVNDLALLKVSTALGIMELYA